MAQLLGGGNKFAVEMAEVEGGPKLLYLWKAFVMEKNFSKDGTDDQGNDVVKCNLSG